MRGESVRRLRIVGVVVVAIVVVPGVALAAWVGADPGSGFARATIAPAGSIPSVSVLGRSVSVSWTASTFSDGGSVSGYTVARYDAVWGLVQTVHAACAGTISALSCTEDAVPPGSWRYSVTPRKGRWIGVESGLSPAVTVGAPTFTLSPSTITSLPATRPGSLTNYASGETVAYHLDGSGGPVLTGSTTPSPLPASGAASASVTIPTGTPDGVHTLYAVGSGGSSATATVTIDTTAPAVAAASIQKAAGGAGGRIKQGGSYFVYAQVSDAPAGVTSVTANASAVTTGATAVPLSFGSWTVDGVVFDYRSPVRTADAVLAEGSKSFSVTATDTVGNAGTVTGFSVTVDNTPPGGADVQTANVAGGTDGRAETGDTATFSFSEAIDPASVLAGWNGAPTSVTVRIIQQNGGDLLQVWDGANATQLPLGEVDLGGSNYVQTTSTFTGSSMTMSGTTVIVTLGTLSSGTVKMSHNAAGMSWTPSAAATDLAGNVCLVTPAAESGASDVEF